MDYWYVVIFNRDELPIGNTVSANFLKKESEIFHLSGSPEDFAIFKDLTPDGLEIYYLSPVAYSFSHNLLQEYDGRPCQKPTLSKEFGAMAFGDKNGTSWNLLD